jgi:hypothetical protein
VVRLLPFDLSCVVHPLKPDRPPCVVTMDLPHRMRHRRIVLQAPTRTPSIEPQVAATARGPRREGPTLVSHNSCANSPLSHTTRCSVHAPLGSPLHRCHFTLRHLRCQCCGPSQSLRELSYTMHAMSWVLCNTVHSPAGVLRLRRAQLAAVVAFSP